VETDISVMMFKVKRRGRESPRHNSIFEGKTGRREGNGK
jgi:hypothetical protein